MKRSLLMVSVLVIIAFGAVSAWLFHSSSIAPRITLSLVGYTNDTSGFRSRFYRVPDPSDRSMAVFELANNTGRWFIYNYSMIQIKTQGRWSDDTNWMSPYSTGPPKGVDPTKSVKIAFPVPAGTNTWRCSVGLLDGTQFFRPRWQRQITAMMRWIGLVFYDNYFTIWSPEIVR